MPFIFKKYYPLRNIFFFAGEGLILFVTVNAVYLFLKGTPVSQVDWSLCAVRALLITVVFQLSLYFLDLYDLGDRQPFSETVARLFQAFGLGCVLLGIIYYLFPVIMISSLVFWVVFFIICVTILIWRFLYNYVLERRLFTQPLVIVGTGDFAGQIAREIMGRRDSGYRIAAFFGDVDKSETLPADIPVYTCQDDLLSVCVRHHVENIIVSLDDRRGATPVEKLLACKLQGLYIEDGISFYEGLTSKIMVEKVNPAWLIFARGFKQGKFGAFNKRLLDILFAVIGLFITLPITLISACIIKLETPGPVFYTQERVGVKGKVFKMIKFRSMISDAEKNGVVWAREYDDRVTRYGRVIRKLRIDEIPQMVNVLKGDMSFVGPRPERPYFVTQLIKKLPYYSLRHNVKPGISGWAQILYPYGASEEDALHKLEYELYYLKNMSLAMDLRVIFETVKIVIFQKGAR